MSWTGTVRCSHCYEQGHNRRGCPKLKEYITENPESYEARKLSLQKSRYTERRCSYCKEAGHNRRKCASKLQHQTEWVAHNRKWCKLMHESLKERGLGVGSLVKLTDSEWDIHTSRYVDQENLYVVKGFDLRAMNFEMGNHPGDHMAMRLAPAKELMNHRSERHQFLPYHEILNNMGNYYRGRAEFPIVGPIECTGAAVYGSGDYWAWLMGDLGVDAIFKGREVWDYPSEGYNDICDLRSV